MKHNYKGLSDSKNCRRLARISAIIIMVMVWVLIDKGNIYGQEVSVRTVINKSDVSSTTQSPLLREGDGTPDKLESDESNNLVVKPNPFTKELVFDFEFTIRTGIPYTIMDPMGRLIDEGIFEPGVSTHQLDLSHLKTGMYLVRLDLGHKLEVKRVIKK